MIPAKMNIGDPRLLTRYAPVRILDQGDVLEFEVTPSAKSVFVLSQKFHRDWQACVYVNKEWQAARTVEVNGVFQGVLLPAESSRVRLEFKPFVRYAWIGHVILSGLLLMCIFAGISATLKKLQGKNAS